MVEDPSLCKENLATPEELAEIEELLKEFKNGGVKFMIGGKYL